MINFFGTAVANSMAGQLLWSAALKRSPGGSGNFKILKQQKVMDSILNNNINTLKRRLILMIGILVGISTMVLAAPVEEADRLSADEAQALILKVKNDLNIEEVETPVLEFDEDGNILNTPVTTIKIYDDNNVLLLEAPIHKLEEMSNKHLSKLINASDFLIENHNTRYYRLALK